MTEPTFFFEPFGRIPNAGARAKPIDPTMWMIRTMAGLTLGIVEKAGPGRYSAHRGARMIGVYPSLHNAAAALEKAHLAAEAAKSATAAGQEEARI